MSEDQVAALEAEVAALLSILETLINPEPEEISRAGIRGYADQVERIALEAGAMGLLGLQDAGLLFQEKLIELQERARPLDDAERECLETWPILVMGYLGAPGDTDASQALVDSLRNPIWPTPLSDDDAAILLDVLQQSPIEAEAELVEVDHLQVDLPEPVAAAAAAFVEPVEAIAIEALEPVEEIQPEAPLQEIVASGLEASIDEPEAVESATTDEEQEESTAESFAAPVAAKTAAVEAVHAQEAHTKAAQRIAHTLKGAGNTVGVRGIATLTHAIEDILVALSRHETLPTGQFQEQFRNAVARNRALADQSQRLQQLTAELEQLVDIRNVATPIRPAHRRGDFDPLELEQYNELNTVTHRLLEAVADYRELGNALGENLRTMDAMLTAQHRLQRNSQDVVLRRTRMTPVQTIVPRLQRAVRQTCRLVDKQAELTVRGAETLIDSNVLNEVSDPFSPTGRCDFFQLGAELYAYTVLAEQLHLPPERRTLARVTPAVLLVREDSGNLRAVSVEDITDSRELVVKPLRPYIPALHGVIGAAILGDGGIAPLLDLPDLLRTSMADLALPDALAKPATAAPDPQRPFVLAVIDGRHPRWLPLATAPGGSVLTEIPAGYRPGRARPTQSWGAAPRWSVVAGVQPVG